MSIISRTERYNYYKIGTRNAYGEIAIPTNIAGTIEMDIEIMNQTTEEGMVYSGATYYGLTKEDISDSYIIEYGTEKLKVLYVNHKGKYNLAYLARM